jgi:hypothetical protein
VLEADHKAVVLSAGEIGCGVALDRCRLQQEPEAPRWDYVFTHRGKNEAYGIEVHHAAADQVNDMIAKKAWAKLLLHARCPDLTVEAWVWVASPPDGEIFFLRQSPSARLLTDAGIGFPVRRIVLP